MTEHRILQLQRRNRRAAAERSQDSPKGQVHQKEEHRRIVRTAKRPRESGFPRPTGDGSGDVAAKLRHRGTVSTALARFERAAIRLRGFDTCSGPAYRCRRPATRGARWRVVLESLLRRADRIRSVLWTLVSLPSPPLRLPSLLCSLAPPAREATRRCPVPQSRRICVRVGRLLSSEPRFAATSTSRDQEGSGAFLCAGAVRSTGA